MSLNIPAGIANILVNISVLTPPTDCKARNVSGSFNKMCFFTPFSNTKIVSNPGV